MSKPHKWAEVIHAWADGKAIQYRIALSDKWNDLKGEPSFASTMTDWRIKPEPKVLRYRVALMNACSSMKPSWVAVAYEGDSYTATRSDFIRWLTDWQTVEIEDGEQ